MKQNLESLFTSYGKRNDSNASEAREENEANPERSGKDELEKILTTNPLEPSAEDYDIMRDLFTKIR